MGLELVRENMSLNTGVPSNEWRTITVIWTWRRLYMWNHLSLTFGFACSPQASICLAKKV